MAQFSKDSFRGLVLPDPRVNEANIDASASSFSQAGPQPGIPQPQAQTDLNLEASGTQSANKTLQIVTHKGGHPGRGGASFRWKESTDANTEFRGAWPASAMSSWRTLRTVNPTASTGARAAKTPHACLMQNGSVGVVYHKTHRFLGTSYEQIKFFSISADGTTSSDVDVYQSSILSGLSAGLHPCILQLPSGRLLLFHYKENKSADTMQVQSFFSDDNGANWSVSNEACLDEAIDISGSAGAGAAGYDLGTLPSAKLRAAYSGGQVLLLISMRANDTSGSFRDGLIQYASSNLGNSFEQVEIWDRTSTATQAEIVPSVNGFEVFFVGGTVGSDAVIRKSLASAFVPLQTAGTQNGPGVLQAGNWAPGSLISGSGGINQGAGLATCLGDDGILYVIAQGRHTSGTYASSNMSDLRICMDTSGGASKNTFYQLMGQGTSATASGAPKAGVVFFGEGGADHPDRFALTAAHGRLYLFHNHTASTSNRDDALGLMTLGGYTTTTLSMFDESGSIARQVCWDHTWIPIEIPDNFAGWTATTAGTSSASVNDGYLALSTTSGRIQYDKTPPGTIAEGIVAWFGVQHVSQIGPVADLVNARFTQADGSDKHTLDVYIRAGAIDAQDNNGGTLLGTLAIDTQTTGVEVLVFFRDGKATVLARPMNNDADRQWSSVCSNATVSDSGTGTSEVRFGHIAGSTASSRWYWFHYVSDEFAGGTPSSTGFTNPDDLIGKQYSDTIPTFVDDGVRIKGIAGPTTPLDEWHISTRYDFPITNILPSVQPSPSKAWRSLNESEQSIVWSFTGANGYSTLGLMLSEINFKTATLFGFNPVSSSYVSLASINASTGQTSLQYLVNGTSVTVNTSATTSPGRYFEIDELIGGTIVFSSPGPTVTERKITGNTAGVWTNTAGHQLPGLEYSGTAVTANGTLDIWSPRILVAVHNVSRLYTKFKLTIDANQDTVEGYYTIGQMVLGPLHLFSQDYSFGRVLETQPSTEITTYRDGSRSSSAPAANRRAVSFGWADGVDVSGTQETVSADYLVGTSTGGAPVIGYRGDMPSVLTQLNAKTQGPHVPLVYVPKIPAGTPNTATVQGLGPIYGRMIGGVQLDSVLGEEATGNNAGEVFRIANVRIEEEL